MRMMYNSGKSVWHTIGANRLHGRQWGQGKKLLLCFHGYSNSSAMYTDLPALLAPDWTVVALDLPGHGQTEWTEQATISGADLRQFVQECCTAYGVESCSLLGFSLGGRFALSVLAQAPGMIHKVVLAAPDGLSTNPIYRLTNNSRAGNSLFQHVLHHPEGYGRLLDLLAQKKILPAQKAQFFKYHLSSPASTRLLSSTWSAMGRMYPSTAQLVQAITAHKIPVHVLMGISDPVIPIALGEKFQAACPEWIHLHPLHKAHRVLDAEGMRLAVKCLQD